MKRYLLLIIISIIAIGSFIFSYHVTPTSGYCTGRSCWAGSIDCGTDCCNCTGGTQKCCFNGCGATCGPTCVTRTVYTATIPFYYSQGGCGSAYTITTLPFSTNLGTYYTIPVNYSYTGE